MSATGLDVFDKTLQTTHIWLNDITEVIGPVENEACQRVEVAGPGRLGENALGIRITSIPEPANAGRAEVDVLGIVLALQRSSSGGASRRTTCMRGSHKQATRGRFRWRAPL